MTNSLALIIEDDEFLAEIFSLTLQEAEFEIEIIRDGRVALTRLAAITPALVVLDLHLPHISGVAILHQIRADQRLAETRVMLATADAILADNLREDADLVLLKPISTNQLRELAKRLHPPDVVG
jgi:two-component system, cell cycle response regulator DivK